MMKTMKKLTAFVLALAMTMAMGVTAFAEPAQTAGTVTVTVKIENPNAKGTYYTKEITLNADKSVYDLPDNQNETIENYDEKATAMDAIIEANKELNIGAINYYRVQYVEENDEGQWLPIDRYGIAFDELIGKKQESIKDGDTTIYYYWQLLIDGKSALNYATAYELKPGMVITVDWSKDVY